MACVYKIFIVNDLFPTTKKELDILKYKPISHLKNLYITNDID